MASPQLIFNEITKLTTDLISLSLSNHQNFPTLSNIGNDCQEIAISGRKNISYTLKNRPYSEIYIELQKTQTYNLKMLDGALIQMMYRFRKKHLEEHRLAFFPSPFLEEFQNNPEIYLEDELYAEVIMKNIVPFPLRFDFNCTDEVVVNVEHPKSHMTLGQYQNCRIPVSGPLTPYQFICFILRNFYHTAFHKYCSDLSRFTHNTFKTSITKEEMRLLYVQIPFTSNSAPIYQSSSN